MHQDIEQFWVNVAVTRGCCKQASLPPSTPPSDGAIIQQTPMRFAPPEDSARSRAYFR